MTTAVAAPPGAVPARGGARPGRHRRARLLRAMLFLAPALVFLGALVVYPILYTLWRSFYNAGGGSFIGVDNYVTMFSDPATFTAIRNNFLWVLVAPLACTALGLVFAVLMEKIRWKTAFRLIIFMPMAISMLAAGVIFRTVFQEDPKLGLANAVVTGVQQAFADPAAYPGARPRLDAGLAAEDGGIVAVEQASAGAVVDFPLVGVRRGELPEQAAEAVAAAGAAGEIAGTVWLDTVPGGGEAGVLGEGKQGLPGIAVHAVDADGGVAAQAITEADGRYRLSGLDPGDYRVLLPPGNFAAGATGLPWLGPSLINAVVIAAYIWIWAGFAMIMIASGLAALDRSVQEAARVDGASEWQVFRRITAPMLMPVLVVVFITLVINVLKIFDLVYVIPPGASKPAANVIAVEMWNVSFGGGNDQGLGSALAILLLLLVLPAMIMNVRRFRQERRA